MLVQHINHFTNAHPQITREGDVVLWLLRLFLRFIFIRIFTAAIHRRVFGGTIVWFWRILHFWWSQQIVEGTMHLLVYKFILGTVYNMRSDWKVWGCLWDVKSWIPGQRESTRVRNFPLVWLDALRRSRLLSHVLVYFRMLSCAFGHSWWLSVTLVRSQWLSVTPVTLCALEEFDSVQIFIKIDGSWNSCCPFTFNSHLLSLTIVCSRRVCTIYNSFQLPMAHVLDWLCLIGRYTHKGSTRPWG